MAKARGIGRLRIAFAGALAVAAAAVGCELIAGLQDRQLCVNGCVDVAEEPPFEAATNPNFQLAVSPPSIVVEPNGPGVPVAITLTRIGGFAEAVAISLSNPPPGLSGSAIIPGNANTGTLNIFADGTAVANQANVVTVAAQSTPSGIIATQPLTIRVGHVLLAATASTTFVVPNDVQNATITSWGAGGSGGGTTTTMSEQGGAGGAGGFAEGTFPVTAGETLTVVVGAPGGAGGNTAVIGYGGSGGGYSAVIRESLVSDGGVDSGPIDAGDAGDSGAPSPWLVVAGGGGGGGGGFYYNVQPVYSGPGKPGGAGSGDNGANGSGTGGGKGATTIAGGAGGSSCGSSGAGTFLQGGNAGTLRNDGGVPGGGYGNSVAGGGGGGGYYGGGSGAAYGIGSCPGGNGGGGGSGHVDVTATNVTTAAGTGNAAPDTNHKYYVNGVAVGGATATMGGAGYVVISVP